LSSSLHLHPSVSKTHCYYSNWYYYH